MKANTKLKIIRFIEWLVNYKQPMCIPLESEKKKIIKVVSQTLLYEFDFKYNIEEIITSDIIKELLKQKLIRIDVMKSEKKYIHESDTWIALSEINVIK